MPARCRRRVATYRRRVHIELTALVVENYDDAIRFFVDALGFDLTEDSPATTNDGRPKRWVVVRPPDAQTGLLLAEADRETQVDAIGRQYAVESGCFSVSTTSRQLGVECSTMASSSSRSLATSPTAALPCSSTSRGTGGIYSDADS